MLGLLTLGLRRIVCQLFRHFPVKLSLLPGKAGVNRRLLAGKAGLFPLNLGLKPPFTQFLVQPGALCLLLSGNSRRLYFSVGRLPCGFQRLLKKCSGVV